MLLDRHVNLLLVKLARIWSAITIYIIGMRNRVIHDYSRVNYDIVWDVVTLQLPGLISQLETFLPPEADSSLPE